MIHITNDINSDAKYDRDPAHRVGYRIKKIRTTKNMSRAELAEKINLPANRIEGYESGFRKPKLDLLQQIATALEVSPFALMDSDNESSIGTMYSLFEISEFFDLEIDDIDGLPIIKVIDPDLQVLVQEWKKAQLIKKNLPTDNDIVYKQWMWNFEKNVPESIAMDERRRQEKVSKKEIKAQQKKETQAEIDELNARLAELKKKLSEM